MSEEEPHCTYCGGFIEEGFVGDQKEGSTGVLQWFPGPVQYGLLGGIKTAFKQRHDVIAHRCEKCGHLELFVPGHNPADPGTGRDPKIQV